MGTGLGSLSNRVVKLDDPDLIGRNFVVEGTTADGMPARGGFSVLRQPPKPTPENSNPAWKREGRLER